MKIPFTKMHGAGNDFVVIDETQVRYPLSAEHYRFIANRQMGIGADQILSVRPAPYPGVDFEYIIHNADGSEVEHCGNGARCFVRFVHESGLSSKNPIRVKVHNGEIELKAQDDGRVKVDMGPPVFELGRVPFDASYATKVKTSQGAWSQWTLSELGLALASGRAQAAHSALPCPELFVLSMGNPHAVMVVPSVEDAPVQELGPLIEHHPAFPKRVNVGFMQIVSRAQIALRVFERGSGETLACGTGACAAVVAGIRAGLLGPVVDVQTRGGKLTIEWAGSATETQPMSHVFMTGPAVSVFKGEITIHD
jgi:diaminopimelate epimerase